MQFNEQIDLEQGFAPIFDAQIAPRLADAEQDRRARLKRSRMWVAGLLGGAVVLIVLLLSLSSAGFILFLNFAFGIGAIFGALGVRSHHAKAWAGRVEDIVMPPICDHVGELRFDSRGGGTFPVSAFRELGMVGSYNKSNIRNELLGTHHSTDFRIVQATLQSETTDSDNDTSTSTVFDGLMFHISVPIEAPGQILIARDWGSFGNKLSGLFSGKRGRGMPKVDFDHQEFEAAFEVHADNPDQAKAFMPDSFLEALLAIGEAEGGAKGTNAMRAGFIYGNFYLALSRKDGFMKMGALNKPVTDMESDIHGIFDDIALAHRIIDRLHGL